MSRQKNDILLFTLIFPFFGLIYSLIHWKEAWAKNVFWLSCVFLGAVFIYNPEGMALGEGADGGRYALDLISYYNSNLSIGSIVSQYQMRGGTVDLYQPIVTYLVSRFTDNGHVLFAVYAFVFGFFYSRNIWYILEKLPNRRLGWIVILVALYFLICPITQINGVRMWTALHVYVYAMMPLLIDNDKSKLWWLITVPFIHFSYLYVCVFAVLFVFLRRMASHNRAFQLLSLVFFITTFFINSLNVDSMNSMLAEFSPESYEDRIDLYINQEAFDRKADAFALSNWYIAASGNIQRWCCSILLVFMLPCLRKYFNEDKSLMNVYVFSLFLGGLANILSMLPSGGRFQYLSLMFTIPLIILVAINLPKSNGFLKLVNIGIVFLMIPLVVEFRTMLDYFGITLLIGNFFTCWFFESNIPIINFIKTI